MKSITLFFIISLVICSNELAAMGTGADGPLLVDQDMPLIGDDNEFDFLSIFISSGATLSAEPSSYPSGISIFSLGDIYVNGLIDFSGIDLTISTPGTFEVGPTGGFLADNYSISANEVILAENFQVVPGGTMDISTNPSGATVTGIAGEAYVDFTGYGVTLVTHLFVPAVNPGATFVPIPPAIGLIALPLLFMRVVNYKTRVS